MHAALGKEYGRSFSSVGHVACNWVGAIIHAVTIVTISAFGSMS